MKINRVYRKIALILIMLLITLSGCQLNSANTLEQEVPNQDDANMEGTYYNTDYTLLKWAMVDTGEEIRGDIARAFNKALLEEGYNFQVEFVMCPVEEGKSSYETFINETNGKVDVLTIRNCSKPGPGIGYPVEDVEYELPVVEFVKNDILLPLDDYVNKELIGIVNDEKDWTKCKYNGVIYGIPSTNYTRESRVYEVNKEVFDKSGLSFKDMAKEWWELDEALEAIYKANGCKSIISYDSGMPIPVGYLKDYDMISTSIGIVDGKAVNIFEQKDIREMLEAWQRYMKKGYTTNEGKSCVNYEISNSEGKVMQRETMYDEEVEVSYLIPYGEIKANRYTDRFSHGFSICAKSDNVEMSIELMSAIQKNIKLRRIINYGIEGKDYEEKDNVITRSNDSEFYGTYSTYGEKVSGQIASGSAMLDIIDKEVKSDQYTDGDLTTATWDNKLSPYKDFTMDLSKYRAQLEKMEELKQDFYNNFSLEGDIAEQLDQYNKDLKAAGIEDVIKCINVCLEKRNASK